GEGVGFGVGFGLGLAHELVSCWRAGWTQAWRAGSILVADCLTARVQCWGLNPEPVSPKAQVQPNPRLAAPPAPGKHRPSRYRPRAPRGRCRTESLSHA